MYILVILCSIRVLTSIEDKWINKWNGFLFLLYWMKFSEMIFTLINMLIFRWIIRFSFSIHIPSAIWMDIFIFAFNNNNNKNFYKHSMCFMDGEDLWKYKSAQTQQKIVFVFFFYVTFLCINWPEHNWKYLKNIINV